MRFAPFFFEFQLELAVSADTAISVETADSGPSRPDSVRIGSSRSRVGVSRLKKKKATCYDAAGRAGSGVPHVSLRPAAFVLHRPSSSFSVSPRTQAVTPTNSSLHYCRHVWSQLRRQKAITCWDDDDEEHGNEIEAGGQLRLLLPHDLLSSSCRSDLDLFFVIRSFLRSSSLDRWFFFRSVLLLFFRFVLHRRFFFGFGVLRVLKLSLRDSVLLFKTGVLETQDLCGIFCPLCPAERLAKRVFETWVLIWISSF